jgi:hypothetical protein
LVAEWHALPRSYGWLIAVELCESSVVIQRPASALTGLEVWPVQLGILLLTLGFRLAQGSNHQDVIGDLPHLDDFKKATAKDLQRTITWRFSADEVEWQGHSLGVETAAALLEADAEFAAEVEALPGHETVQQTVLDLLRARPICLRCRNPRVHDRELIVPIGGDPKLIARLAQEYEQGF